jgi:soluble lytic murein transglycosylase-like protein
MLRRRALVLAAALLVAACSGGAASPEPSSPESLGPSEGGASEQPAGPQLPAPDQPVPQDPAVLSTVLERATQDLYDAIDRWLARDPNATRSPEDVQLLALYQQRITRVLAHEPPLAARVIGLLSPSVAAITRANVVASQRLFAHARPVSDASVLRTERPESAGTLLGFYREAERRFGVEWQVLAAVNAIESRFGRVRSSSYAGAQGPMQFLPSTWDAYGMGGDVHDPHDAILGAANYLAASGAPADDRAALYHYNPVNDYVKAVLLYAGQMERDPRAYYAYYNWQVFVFTKQGEVRLTGPGT